MSFRSSRRSRLTPFEIVLLIFASETIIITLLVIAWRSGVIA